MIKELENLQITEGTEEEIWGLRAERLGEVKRSREMRVRMMIDYRRGRGPGSDCLR